MLFLRDQLDRSSEKNKRWLMEQNLKKMAHENESQYIWRIGQAKDAGLINYTWGDLSPILNAELDIDETEWRGESAWRKKYRVMQQAYDDVFSKQQFGENHVNELQQQKRELDKARYKLQAVNLESNRLLKQESRFELFYENVRDVISTLSPPEPIVVESNKYHSKNKEYMLTIADVHAGAKFEINGNRYSLDECEKRFEKLLQQVVEYIIENNIRKISVVELSDTIQGILRVSDVKLNETTVMVAVVTIARIIANFLNELSAYCEVNYYHTPHSNHSQMRPIGTKASELATEDLEYVISHYIKDILAHNQRVNVHLNDFQDEIWVNIFDYNIIALHGHTVKNIKTALKDLSAKHNKLIDYVVMGHFHNGQSVAGNERDGYDTEVLVCPSFQGTDPYAFNKLGYSSKAACKMFIFDEQHGCTGTEKFILN